MTQDDVGGYASLSDPQIHPDGVRIAFAVSRMNLQEDRYDRQIWLWNGTTARPFTHGPGDTRPRRSPRRSASAGRAGSAVPGTASTISGGCTTAAGTSIWSIPPAANRWHSPPAITVTGVWPGVPTDPRWASSAPRTR